MREFKRIADMKLSRPPALDQELMWAQLAQHYGLPTRLLDWSESATAALYFAVQQSHEDGIVFVLNPIDLNRLSNPSDPRVLDAQRDQERIQKYFASGVDARKNGAFPIALNPMWNSDRLIQQKGVFTLHGRRFSMDDGRISSLVGIPILADFKPSLRTELQRVGVDEMTLFPELEHACAHLKRKYGLGHEG